LRDGWGVSIQWADTNVGIFLLGISTTFQSSQKSCNGR
jgi:hypothetical protein